MKIWIRSLIFVLSSGYSAYFICKALFRSDTFQVLNSYTWLVAHLLSNIDLYKVCMRAKSLQSCLTLSDPMDCSLPGSSVHGVLQTRILEWIAMPSSRESSWPRDWTHINYLSFLGRQPSRKPSWLSLAAMRETRVRSLDREDPLEKEIATHTSILA